MSGPENVPGLLLNLRDGGLTLTAHPSGMLVLHLRAYESTDGGGVRMRVVSKALDPEEAAELASAVAGWFGGRLVRDDDEDQVDDDPAEGDAPAACPQCSHPVARHTAYGCSAHCGGGIYCACPRTRRELTR